MPPKSQKGKTAQVHGRSLRSSKTTSTVTNDAAQASSDPTAGSIASTDEEHEVFEGTQDLAADGVYDPSVFASQPLSIEDDAVPILAFGKTISPAATHWLREIFPQGLGQYFFPIGVPKDGHLHDDFDKISRELSAKKTTSGKDASLYRALGFEWKTLKQSVVYGVLIGQALSEVREFVHNIAEEDESVGQALENSNFQDRLEELERIQINLLKDQVKRAPVVIAAAIHDFGLAQEIHSSIEAETYTVHSSVLGIFKQSRQGARGRGRGRGQASPQAKAESAPRGGARRRGRGRGAAKAATTSSTAAASE